MKKKLRNRSDLLEQEIERGEMLADDFGTPLDNEGDLQPARWLNRPEVRDA